MRRFVGDPSIGVLLVSTPSVFDDDDLSVRLSRGHGMRRCERAAFRVCEWVGVDRSRACWACSGGGLSRTPRGRWHGRACTHRVGTGRETAR